MSTVLPQVVFGADAKAESEAEPGLPNVSLPVVPGATLLWSRLLKLVSILVLLMTLDAITVLLGDLWLLRSVGLESVFWTNFRMGALLYGLAFVLFGAAVLVPALMHRISPAARRSMLSLAFLSASVGAYFGALQYQQFLLGSRVATFGKADPVFGLDIAFYSFDLPNILEAWRFLLIAAVLFLVISSACAYAATRNAEQNRSIGAISNLIGAMATPASITGWIVVGLLVAFRIWLGRFDLLQQDNSAASIKRGAQYLDVEGLLSNLNYMNLSTLIAIALTFVIARLMRGAASARERRNDERWPADFRKGMKLALLLLALDFGFKGLVVVRNWIAVKPNEPVIQLPYIARHIDATRAAYGLDAITPVSFRPAKQGDPVPSAEALLASPTLKNAPLWPGFTSYLERWLDRQHSERILKSPDGSHMVYGPTLEIFQQQQKLRTYYNFVNVDTVRYTVNGEKKMFVSSVRETPLYEPVPWLAYWGQRFMMFTHGFGLVVAPAGEVGSNGEPRLVSRDVPSKTDHAEMKLTNERVYYGEGSATMAFSNVSKMKELDYPTEQDRAEIFLPADVPSGVAIDSLAKRLVFGWRSGKFFELVFSDLIDGNTRAHFYRTPLERLRRIAPFIYFDSNPYAVASEGKIFWIVNGLTTSDRYPYSLPEELGDKSDERSPFPAQERRVNYVEDSIKATVDGFTGQVRLYKIKDAPVVNAWSKVYPDLFVDAAEMPVSVSSQLTYPTHLMHLQFDDLYIYYHMQDPMYFFNQEDMWDDGDEVLGPIMDSGEAITFSIEPFTLLLDTGKGPLPAANPPVQFSQAMIFTPEKALNLRGIPIVYQDPPDYGKLSVLQIPKGEYVLGPEQADAAIDQDPDISQSFSWWNRRGTEVIRGHTTLLMVGNEVLYVEPVFLRSQQNSYPQMKKVIVVMRGRPFMDDSLEKAVRAAVSWHQANGSSGVIGAPVVMPDSAASVVTEGGRG